jgi:hypothetical protein
MPLERSRDFRELASSVSGYRSGRPDIGPRRPDSARNGGSQINLGGDRDRRLTIMTMADRAGKLIAEKLG